jgi:alkylation response protein AidB-like acyl-CoA dehydrogenase
MTIARDRWQQHLKTRGDHYHAIARELEALPPQVGGDVAALAHHALAEMLEACRTARLTRHQHILLRLGELEARTEGAGALARRAAAVAAGTTVEKTSTRFDAAALAAMSRIAAREAALTITTEGLRWVGAAEGGDAAALAARMGLPAVQAAQDGLIADLDLVADVLYRRT